MDLVLDLSSRDIARLSAAAHKKGMAPADLARQLVAEHLPLLDDQQETRASENAPAIALLESWLRDEATDDPQVIAKAEQELEEFKRNLDANRAETGERLFFP